MDPNADLDLTTVLQAGLTADVALLQSLGKALPVQLQAQYRETIAILRAVRGLTRASAPTATRLALLQRLDSVARGSPMRDFAPEWDGMVDSFASQGPLAADLLQAAQRELAAIAGQHGVLFAGWSDFYNHTRFSLVPVGRALLQGHTGRSDAMDALMTALALTAALQEAAGRLKQQRLLAIPLQWLTAEGLTPAALAGSSSTPALRKSLRRGVERVRELLAIADSAPMPAPLAPFAAAGLFLIRRLARRLERSDPLARPVRLGIADRLMLRLKHRL